MNHMQLLPQQGVVGQSSDKVLLDSDSSGLHILYLQLQSHLMSKPSGVRLQGHQRASAPSSSEELSLSAELSSGVS